MMKRFSTFVLAIMSALLLCQGAFAQGTAAEGKEYDCQDGADNDGDGFADCNDKDCYDADACTSAGGAAPPAGTAPAAGGETGTGTGTAPGTETAPAGEEGAGTAPAAGTDTAAGTGTAAGDGTAAGTDATTGTELDPAPPPPGPGGPPGPGPGKPGPGKPGPRPGTFGIGIFPILVTYAIANRKSTSEEDSDRWSEDQNKMKFTGGVGIFGEFTLQPFLVLGAEVFLFFPKVDEIRFRDYNEEEWSDWRDYDYGETSIVFGAMFRIKFPILIGPWVGLYPLVALGIGNYTNRAERMDAENYTGLVWAVAVGAEVYVPTPILVTPFLELRYYGGSGWREDDVMGMTVDQRAILSTIVINLGVRIL